MMKSAQFLFAMSMLLFPSTLLVLAYCWRHSRDHGTNSIRELERGARESRKGSNVRALRQHTSVEFPVPEDVIGYVIGRRGYRVRGIEEDTGARVRFKDQQGFRGKVVVVSGKPENVGAAKEAIEKIVEERLQWDANQQETVVLLPSSEVGKVIGRQGSNIRSIQRQSGAKVLISRVGSGDRDRECTVRGSRDAVAMAIALIHSSMGTPQTPIQHYNTLQYAKLPCATEYFPVFVSAVTRMGEVWLQLVEEDDLDSLVEAMTHFYSQPSTSDSCSGVCVGMMCAAPFPHDSSWYRAVVTSLTSDCSRAGLLYVDFGDEGCLNVKDLKLLREEYAVLPAQAIKCSLHAIIPHGETWSDAGLLALEELTHCARWEPVMVKVMDRSSHLPAVDITDTTTHKDVNVAERMVYLGHARWTGRHPPQPHSACYHSNSSVCLDVQSLGHVKLPNNEFEAYITAVESLDTVYIMPTRYEPTLLGLTQRMGVFYSSDQSVACPLPGEPVAVNVDDLWYRAQVISIEEGLVAVQCLDYGSCFALPHQLVRTLRTEFQEEQYFSVGCSLKNDGHCVEELKRCCVEWKLFKANVLSQHKSRSVVSLTPSE